jgi:putative membrane protein
MVARRETFGVLSEAAHAPLLSALAVGAGGTWVVALVDLGPVANHMALHIASMNIVAPLAAVAVRAYWRGSRIAPAQLWLAALAQMIVLWGAHVPTIHHLSHASLIAGVLMQSTLFLAALFFWLAIFDALTARWNAIAALLVSGKLACLLGALLIFAPRPLFGSMQHGEGQVLLGAMALDDQHLAGLFMVTACPLSYVLAAIVLTTRAVLPRNTQLHVAPDA